MSGVAPLITAAGCAALDRVLFETAAAACGHPDASASSIRALLATHCDLAIAISQVRPGQPSHFS